MEVIVAILLIVLYLWLISLFFVYVYPWLAIAGAARGHASGREHRLVCSHLRHHSLACSGIPGHVQAFLSGSRAILAPSVALCDRAFHRGGQACCRPVLRAIDCSHRVPRGLLNPHG